MEILQRLLSLGFDINQQDNAGWTALTHAAYWNNKNKIKILLEHGINTTIKNDNGRTALDIAENQERTTESRWRDSILRRYNHASVIVPLSRFIDT